MSPRQTVKPAGDAAVEGNLRTLRQWLLLRSLAADSQAVTIKRLVAETGVSDKTIRRDVAELRQAGFPIVEQVGDFGRKSFALESAALPLLTFTYDEALALNICRSSDAQFSGTFIAESLHQAFRKIRATLPRATCEYVERMLGRVTRTGIGGNYADKAELLDQILIGLEDSKAVFVTYQSERSTEPVTYDLFPLGLVEHRGSLYIIGFSPDHDEIRTWKLDRMLDAEVTKMPFQRPGDFDLEKFLANSFGIYHGRQDVQVRVRFAPSAARYIGEKQMHASQTVTPERDGSVIAQWRLSNTVEIRAYILSFGAAAEVLEPTELRDEVREEIARIQAVYLCNSAEGNKKSIGKNNAFRHQRK